MSQLVQAHHTTVSRILDGFEADGLLARTQERSGLGRHLNYTYALQWDAIAALPANGATTAGLDARRTTAGLDARRTTAGLDARLTPVGERQCSNASSTGTGATPSAQRRAPTADAANALSAWLTDAGLGAQHDQLVHAVDAWPKWHRFPDRVDDALAAIHTALLRWAEEGELYRDEVADALVDAAERIAAGKARQPSMAGHYVSRAFANGRGQEGQDIHDDVADAIRALFPRRTA